VTGRKGSAGHPATDAGALEVDRNVPTTDQPLDKTSVPKVQADINQLAADLIPYGEVSDRVPGRAKGVREMEKPTIHPTTGEPLWRPNGARQRFAKRMVEEVPFERVFVAAGQVLRHRMEQRGEIGPDDGIRPTKEQIVNVIAWSNLRQLRLLRRIAEGLIHGKESVH
jgi:hypothetical protein